MDEVAMSGVNLNSVHASLIGTTGSLAKGLDHIQNLVERELPRNMVVVVVGDATAGRNNIVQPEVFGLSLIVEAVG